MRLLRKIQIHDISLGKKNQNLTVLCQQHITSLYQWDLHTLGASNPLWLLPCQSHSNLEAQHELLLLSHFYWLSYNKGKNRKCLFSSYSKRNLWTTSFKTHCFVKMKRIMLTVCVEISLAIMFLWSPGQDDLVVHTGISICKPFLFWTYWMILI